MGRGRQIPIAKWATVAQHFTGDAQRPTAVLRWLQMPTSASAPSSQLAGRRNRTRFSKRMHLKGVEAELVMAIS